MIDKKPRGPIKYNINLTEEQRRAKKLIEDNKVTVLIGRAGSSKSLVSCYTALNLLFTKQYNTIYMMRPAVPIEDLGYLKGPQPLWSKISTPNGWKLMKDMQVGDKVHTPYGTVANVVAVQNFQGEPVYRITTTTGKICHAGESHLWEVTGKPDFETKSLMTTLQLKNDLTRERNGQSPKNFVYKYRLPENQAVEYFQEKELPLGPYTLGVLLGDGILSGSHVRFASNDSEIVNKVTQEITQLNCKLTKNNLIYTISPSGERVNRNRKGSKGIKITNTQTGDVLTFPCLREACEYTGLKDTTLCSRIVNKTILDNLVFENTESITRSINPLINILEDLNLTDKKAWEKRIPQEYLFSSIQNRMELLRGILDTDGTIKSDGETSFITSSLGLAEDITHLIQSLGGRCTFQKPQTPNGKAQKQVINGKECEIISRRTMYTLSISTKENPFYLPRKATRFTAEKSRRFEYIKSIDLVTLEKVKCITLDTPEGLYITDNFIVTHNSLEEKMGPYVSPLLQNFYKIYDKQKIDALIREEKIVIMPLAFVQGLTVDEVLIVDEAENATQPQLKMVLTRLGKGGKIIFTGDVDQVMLKNAKSSGFASLIALKDKEISGFAVQEMLENYRDPFVEQIITLYT